MKTIRERVEVLQRRFRFTPPVQAAIEEAFIELEADLICESRWPERLKPLPDAEIDCPWWAEGL
jgi:hypothetical protein